VLKSMSAIRTGDLVFAGLRGGSPLSNMSLLAVHERMGFGDLTAHGFRSIFPTGQRNAQISRVKWLKWLLPTLLGIRWKRPIDEVICSKKDAA
jgi:hypothetical protein